MAAFLKLLRLEEYEVNCRHSFSMFLADLEICFLHYQLLRLAKEMLTNVLLATITNNAKLVR